MIEILQSIEGYIQTFFQDFLDSVFLLAKGVGLLGEAVSVPFEFLNHLPALIVVGISSAFAVGIIKFIVGR